MHLALTRIDSSADEVRGIAFLSIELRAVDMLEVFSPTRVIDPAVCSNSGLRLGSVVVIAECEQYGQNAGEYWELNKLNNARAPEEKSDYEVSFLLTDSPLCPPISHLPKICAHGHDPVEVKQQLKIGV